MKINVKITLPFAKKGYPRIVRITQAIWQTS